MLLFPSDCLGWLHTVIAKYAFVLHLMCIHALYFRAFVITDMQSKQLNIVTSGATAVSCLLKVDSATGQRMLYVANVGDSRAVLCQKNPATG